MNPWQHRSVFSPEAVVAIVCLGDMVQCKMAALHFSSSSFTDLRVWAIPQDHRLATRERELQEFSFPRDIVLQLTPIFPSFRTKTNWKSKLRQTHSGLDVQIPFSEKAVKLSKMQRIQSSICSFEFVFNKHKYEVNHFQCVFKNWLQYI